MYNDSYQMFTSAVQISQDHVRTPESGSLSEGGGGGKEDFELTEIKSLLPDGMRDLNTT